MGSIVRNKSWSVVLEVFGWSKALSDQLRAATPMRSIQTFRLLSLDSRSP
jgi:hypothetical protein